MNNLIIQGSDKTPHFALHSSGELTFGGVSMPEDAAEFYFKILDWISDYYRNPSNETVINISFRYLNSSSASMIFKIFHCLNRLQASGKTNITCNWNYDRDDEGMREYIYKVKEYANHINFNIKGADQITESLRA